MTSNFGSHLIIERQLGGGFSNVDPELPEADIDLIS